MLLVLPFVVERYAGARFDSTFLIILSMVACAWYLGLGPGLVVAFLLESVLVYFSTAPFSGKTAFITLNRLVLFVSVVVFASSRRKSETRLREQRELLKVTLESIGDAVFATDLNGNVTFLNPAAERMTGWQLDDVRGRRHDEVFQLTEARTDGAAHISDQPHYTFLLTKDGTELPVEQRRSPINDAGAKVIGEVVVFHDVSERRRTDRERERLLANERAARSEAEASNRLKDEFLATVSHELRTPLNAIIGWTSMLKQDDPTPEQIKKALNVVERNAKIQNDLIGDMLDVSQIVSGKLLIETAPVDLVPVIRSAVDTLYPASTAKSISITTSFGAENTVVNGDGERLQQIFWNLLSNAIKFTPAGGSVDVSLRERSPNIAVEFRDSGIGISSEALAHVFERFRQVDASAKRHYGGLGLGLAIVRHLVELHGGKVHAESEGSGRGATFTVEFPAAFVFEDSKDTARKSGRPDLSGLSVLVVDDHADTLEMFCVALQQFGARTKSASSCAEGLRIFAEWRPDVLVSDLGMPGEDGYDLITKIRGLGAESGGSVPAAAVSAYVREEDCKKALAAGFHVHLSKPITGEELARAVSQLAQTANATEAL